MPDHFRAIPQIRPIPGLVPREHLVPRPKVELPRKGARFDLLERQADQVPTPHVFGLPELGAAAAPDTCPGGAGLKPNEQCCPPRVAGFGYSAKAALVSALLEAEKGEVAGEVARCSSFLLHGKREVTLHEADGGGRHFGGLNHCGRVTCPVCGPYLMAKRMEALTPVTERVALDEGLRFFYLVLTLRHRKGGRFRSIVKVLRECQRELIQNRSRWRPVVAGWIRVMETTYGRNGHHPHENMILAINAEQDPDAFFAWIQEKFEAAARKRNRTADWAAEGKDGRPHPWWSEIDREELAKVLHYFGKDEKMGRPPAALREAMGQAHKHQPVWSIPAEAFAEVWMESKGLRWFGVGGVFKTDETDKTDEELSEEREEVAPVIGHIPREVWAAWTPEERRDRQAVLTDRSLTRPQILEYLVACGGVEGPPPEPDWGDAGAGPPG